VMAVRLLQLAVRYGRTDLRAPVAVGARKQL